MEFGLFVEFPSREGTTQAQIFKNDIPYGVKNAEICARFHRT